MMGTIARERCITGLCIQTYKKSLIPLCKLTAQYGCWRTFSDRSKEQNIEHEQWINIGNQRYPTDSHTNVTPKILSFIGRDLHNQKYHPLQLIKQRIVDYMYTTYHGPRGPLFSVYDHMEPAVTLEANFDSLLVPKEHPSRKKSESYYINSTHMLRAHTSAHQTELIKMGLDNFMVVGDVYRRDEIDSSHYPVFHQIEGVRLVGESDLTIMNGDKIHENVVKGFEDGERTDKKQQYHTMDATEIIERDLKKCLIGLTQELFGANIEYKWVDCYFPFTHPSWELEIFHNGKWMEVLGCGIVEQEILYSAGAQDKLGFAFGLGLERLAMILYGIPDIRLFWSKDSGFLNQFVTNDPKKEIVYSVISKFPQCTNDLSFWLPHEVSDTQDVSFEPNDFYDLVRSIGGDLVEQVYLIDEFYDPKKKRKSHCYRIVYRHMEQPLRQEDVNKIHAEIEHAVASKFFAEIR